MTRTFLGSDGGRLFASQDTTSGPDIEALESDLVTADRRLEQALAPEAQDALGSDWAAFVKTRREERDSASAALGAARVIEPSVTGETRQLVDLWAEGGTIEDADRRRLITKAYPRITVERIGPHERVVSVHPAEDEVIL